MPNIEIIKKSLENAEQFLEFKSIPQDEIQIMWIGQAGFILKYKNMMLIIDPYLSDYLAKKNRGKLFPHTRLMKIPINPELLTNLDYILCSHAHSDHMCPETITILSEKNPEVTIVVPAAELEEAINRGAKAHQIIQINDGELISLENKINLIGVAAAHEALKINDKGQHHFLGFVFDFDGVRIYHSGDCVPYVGLTEKLRALEIDIALLPINGRDEYRLKNNIAGNFRISEVIDLCMSAEIKTLIVHHFGMFAYNTVLNDELDELRSSSFSRLQIIVPEISTIYKIKKT